MSYSERLQMLWPVAVVFGLLVTAMFAILIRDDIVNRRFRRETALYFKRIDEIPRRQREIGDKLFTLLRHAGKPNWQCSIWQDEKSSYMIWVEDRRQGAHVWTNFFFIQVAFESPDDEFPIFVRGNPSGLFRYFGESDEEVVQAARAVIDYLDATFAEAKVA